MSVGAACGLVALWQRQRRLFVSCTMSGFSTEERAAPFTLEYRVFLSECRRSAAPPPRPPVHSFPGLARVPPGLLRPALGLGFWARAGLLQRVPGAWARPAIPFHVSGPRAGRRGSAFFFRKLSWTRTWVRLVCRCPARAVCDGKRKPLSHPRKVPGGKIIPVRGLLNLKERGWGEV